MLSAVFGPFVLLIWIWGGGGGTPERVKPECQEILLCWIMQEITKRAERTPETFRDEELWDPLCITSVRAMNFCFVHPIVVLCFFLHYLVAVMMPSLLLCCESMSLQGRISSTKWGEAPPALQEFVPHWTRDRSLKAHNIPIEGKKVPGAFQRDPPGRWHFLPCPSTLLYHCQCWIAQWWVQCRPSVIIPQVQGSQEKKNILLKY